MWWEVTSSRSFVCLTSEINISYQLSAHKGSQLDFSGIDKSFMFRVWTAIVRAKRKRMHLLIHERVWTTCLAMFFRIKQYSILFLFLAIFNTMAQHLHISRSSEKIHLLLSQLSLDTESIFLSSAF